MRGVVGAWGAADLPDLPAIPAVGPGETTGGRDWPALATDRVRYVGQTVAVVVAGDRYAAEDGADAVAVDIENRCPPSWTRRRPPERNPSPSSKALATS
jgi:aerobic carbon-monoxide dehydrogenase large subunit